MSGHSKWSKIKNQKGAADAKRGALFTQLARAITVAAREKGGDPSMNYSLRAAIEKAKAGNLPKDNIDRAIKKGTGEIESEAIEELTYEGYGPGGSAVFVESMTDNKKRTVADLKHIFSKRGGNLGTTGSVAWMFERKGVIIITKQALEGKDPDEFELEMIDAGAEDVKREDGEMTVISKMEKLQETKQAIEKLGYEVESDSLEYLAKEPVDFDPDQHKALINLMEALDDNEDVQAAYTNVNI